MDQYINENINFSSEESAKVLQINNVQLKQNQKISRNHLRSASASQDQIQVMETSNPFYPNLTQVAKFHQRSKSFERIIIKSSNDKELNTFNVKINELVMTNSQNNSNKEEKQNTNKDIDNLCLPEEKKSEHLQQSNLLETESGLNFHNTTKSLFNETSDKSSEFIDEEDAQSSDIDISQFVMDDDLDNSNDFKEEFIKNQSEQLFKQQMKQIIHFSTRKIVKLDVFKHGLNYVIERNVEDEFEFTQWDIQKAVLKSIELIPEYEKQLKMRKRRIGKSLQKAAFDFQQVNELREKINNFEKICKKRIEDQINFVKWIDKIRIQNQGIFIVRGNRFVYDINSLYLFGYQSRIRLQIVWIAEWKWFDRIVVFLILIASFCQAASDNLDPDGLQPYNQKLFLTMEITTYLFIIEAAIKIISQGLWMHKNSYLRSGWNTLDFCVVVMSLLEIIINMVGVEASSSGIRGLRALRVIRPLRSVKRIPRLRRLVSIMLRSLPELGNTLVFLMFFFLVFGIIGIQSFHGVIYQRCRLTPQPQKYNNGTYYWNVDPQQNFICDNGNSLKFQNNQCKRTSEGKETYCFSPLDNPWFLNPELIDDPWEDELLGYNTMNFNNIINSIITCFEAITLEGWSTQMFRIISTGNIILGLCYYLCLVIFGSYFIFNLILAVIMGSFTKFENQEIMEKMQKVQESEMKTIESKEIEEVLTNKKLFLKDKQEKQEKIKKFQMKKQQQEKKNKKVSLGHQKKQTKIALINDLQKSLKHIKNKKKDYQLEKNTDILSEKNSKQTIIIIEQKRSSINNDEINDIDSNNSEQIQKDNLSQQKVHTPFEISDEQEYSGDYTKEPMEMTFNNNYNNDDSNIDAISQNIYDDNVQKITQISQQQDTIIGETSRQMIEEVVQIPKIQKQEEKDEKVKEVVGMESEEEYNDIFKIDENRFLYEDETMIGQIKARWEDLVLISSSKYQKTTLFKFFHQICTNQVFVILILFIIGINSVTLAIDDFPSDRQKVETLDMINQIVTWIFVLELVIKILGLGLYTYAIDPINQFDAIIVTFSIVEMVLEVSQKEEIQYNIQANNNIEKASNQNLLTLFRGFRLFRVFRLARKWKSFHLMMVKIVQSLQDLVTFFILFMIIVFVFALLGNEIFAYRVRLDEQNNIVNYPQNDSGLKLNMDEYLQKGQSPRPNFDNFINAVVGIFVVIIGEDWQIMMHDQIRSQQNRTAPILFFITLYIVGNLFLMNLLLAILLKNFEESGHAHVCEKKDHDNGIYLKKSVAHIKLGLIDSVQKLQIKLRFGKVQRVGPTPSENLFKQKLRINQSMYDHKKILRRNTFGTDIEKTKEIVKAIMFKQNSNQPSIIENPNISENLEGGDSQSSSTISDFKDVQSSNDSSIPASKDQKLGIQKLQKMLSSEPQQKLDIRKIQSRLQKVDSFDSYSEVNSIKLIGTSLFIFSKNNRFRIQLSKIISHQNFEMFIFLSVILSAVLMSLEQPLEDPDLYKFYVFLKLNELISGIFLLELIIKLIVYGLLFNGPESYLNIGWNRLDLTIVIISIISFILEHSTDENNDSTKKNLELFKMLKVLRSLRMISKNEGLKLSVLSLIYSIPGIINVGVVSIICVFLIGIFFLNLLKGALYHCVLPENIEILIGYKQIIIREDCTNFGGMWVNSNINYDNIFNSMFSLFVMCTNEGWVTFMFDAVDSVGIGKQPKLENNQMFELLFLFYMIFGSIFITNLFIEVVINTFDKEKHKIDRNYELTSFQKEWIQVQLSCYEVQPITKIISDNKIRILCIQFLEYEYFDNFIMSVIIFNAITLSMQWVDIDQEFIKYVNYTQDIFTLIFTAECGIKLTAYKLQYFKQSWNIFDFVIVIGGLWGFYNQETQFLSVIRILRVGRVLRLLKKAKRLYQIFNSFLHTIPSFANVGGLILVMLFIFSTAGMTFFAKIKINGSMDEFINFQNFPSAFITLVQCMTGEGWYDVMFSLSKQKQEDFFCINDPSFEDYTLSGGAIGCGSPKLAYIFFSLFVVSINLVLINLFIAVVLQGFNDVQNADMCRITDFHINIFIHVWSEFDPDGTSYIQKEKIGDFMVALVEAKCEIFSSFYKEGIKNDPDIREMYCDRLALKLYSNYTQYNFHDILISVSQKFLIYIASQPDELEEIFNDYEKVHSLQADYLEDVIDQISNIQQKKNVQFCIKLDKKIIKFKNQVNNKIDRFDGNIYTSSFVRTIVFIQRQYRKQKRTQILEIQQEIINRKRQQQAIQFNEILSSQMIQPRGSSRQHMTPHLSSRTVSERINHLFV